MQPQRVQVYHRKKTVVWVFQPDLSIFIGLGISLVGTIITVICVILVDHRSSPGLVAIGPILLASGILLLVRGLLNKLRNFSRRPRESDSLSDGWCSCLDKTSSSNLDQNSVVYNHHKNPRSKSGETLRKIMFSPTLEEDATEVGRSPCPTIYSTLPPMNPANSRPQSRARAPLLAPAKHKPPFLQTTSRQLGLCANSTDSSQFQHNPMAFPVLSHSTLADDSRSQGYPSMFSLPAGGEAGFRTGFFDSRFSRPTPFGTRLLPPHRPGGALCSSDSRLPPIPHSEQ